jgi:hypothetical protein
MTNHNKTASMLQRVPVILAVTASSYGLTAQSGEARHANNGDRQDKPAGRHREAGASRMAAPQR